MIIPAGDSDVFTPRRSFAWYINRLNEGGIGDSPTRWITRSFLERMVKSENLDKVILDIQKSSGQTGPEAIEIIWNTLTPFAPIDDQPQKQVPPQSLLLAALTVKAILSRIDHKKLIMAEQVARVQSAMGWYGASVAMLKPHVHLPKEIFGRHVFLTQRELDTVVTAKNRNPDLSINQLAERTTVSAATLAKLLDKAREEGLLNPEAMQNMSRKSAIRARAPKVGS